MTRYHLTLPDADSPVGRWVMDLATMLGTDYDPNGIAAELGARTGRAAAVLPSPRDPSWRPHSDSAFGQFLAEVALYLGARSDAPREVMERIRQVFDQATASDVPQETSAAEPSQRLAYVATAEDRAGGHRGIVGVSADKSGALALLGAAWVRSSTGGPALINPCVDTHGIDDPEGLVTP